MSELLNTIDEIIGTNVSDVKSEPRDVKWTDANGKEFTFSVEDLNNTSYADIELISFIGMSAYRQALSLTGEPEFIEGEPEEKRAQRLGSANFYAFRKAAPHKINKTIKVNGEVIPFDKAQRMPTGLQMALLGFGGNEEATGLNE